MHSAPDIPLLTKDQVDATALALFKAQPDPNNLTESQLATAAASTDLTTRLEYLNRLEDIRTAARDRQLRADALHCLHQQVLHPESRKEAAAASVNILRALKTSARTRSTDTSIPFSLELLEPLPERALEIKPRDFTSPDALAHYHLTLLNAKKPRCSREVFGLLYNNLAYPIQHGRHTHHITESDTIEAMLPHLGHGYTITKLTHGESLRQSPVENMHCAPVDPPRLTPNATAHVLLHRDNDADPLALKFHYFHDQPFTRFPGIWALESITPDTS